MKDIFEKNRFQIDEMLNEFKLTFRVFVLQIQIHPMNLGGLLLAQTLLIYLAKK